jgi:hypothetical protein
MKTWFSCGLTISKAKTKKQRRLPALFLSARLDRHSVIADSIDSCFVYPYDGVGFFETKRYDSILCVFRSIPLANSNRPSRLFAKNLIGAKKGVDELRCFRIMRCMCYPAGGGVTHTTQLF